MAELVPFSPFLTQQAPGGSLILDRNLLAIKKAIGDATATINRITRIINIDIGGTGANDAQFWVSTASALLPNAVDMSTLGAGVLQQTISGTTAAPQAVSLPEHATLFGGPAGLIDYDAVSYYYLRTVHMAGIANTDAAAIAGLAFVNDNGRGTGTDIPSSSYNIYTTGTSYVGIDGAIAGMDNKLVFMAPNPGVVGYDIGFVWGMSGRRKMEIPWVGGGATDAITQVNIFNPDAGSGAGYSQLLIDNNSTAKLAAVVYGATHPDWPESAGIRAEMSPLLLQTGSPTMTRVRVNTSGTVDVISLGAGGVVWADDPDGTLKLVTIGPGLTFDPVTGELDTAGGGGTVTSVGGTSPIQSSGGTTPVISILDFVASGASHARGAVPDPGAVAGTTKFLREDATWAVPPTSSGTVTSVSASLPLQITGSPTTTPNVIVRYDLVSITLNGSNQLQREALTGDVTATAGSNTTAFRSFTATSVLGRSANSTGAPADIAASADGDVLWRNGTTLGFAALPYSKITGTPTPITWPAAKDILVSTGTSSDPTGEAAFTYDSATNLFRLDGFQGIGVDPSGLGDGKYVLAVYGNATQDRIYLRPGGITLTASGAFKQWELAPATTALSTNPANSLLANAYFDAISYTGGAGSATVAESVTVYIAGPPSMPYEMEGGLYAFHVASGISRFDGAVSGVDLSTSATLGTSGTFAVGGGANLINALGGATQIGFFGATPVGQQTGGSATAGATYTATEQAMLQKAYDCLRSLGFLS